MIHRPKTLSQALGLLSEGGDALTPVAGGTDVLVSWPQREHERMQILDLSQIAPLRHLTLTDDALHLGALATYWDVIARADVTAAYPLLAVAARQVGAIQIQTRGTWAGNIANGSPAADGVPVLMAYDAAVELASTAGRRVVPLDGYYTAYRESVRRSDELIIGIRVPARVRQFEFFEKVGARRAQAITKVGVAVVQDERGIRVVANSVGPTVCRCRQFEQALASGRTFASPQDIQSVIAADVSPIDDIRSTREYRMRVLCRVLHHALKDRPTGKH